MAINKVPFVVASTEAESTAALFRQAISSFLNPAGGTVAEKGLTVKAKATPNMEVEVEGGDPNGQIWIPGTSLSNQGLYFCSVDSTTGLAIGAASTSNPRVDTIVARVKDSFYAGSANEFLLEVIAGTPKAGISKPPKSKAEAEADGAGAVAVSSYVLAYVLVPQNASTITSGDIENVSKQIEAPNAIVGEKALKAETVTDVKIAKGRALVETENSYGGQVLRSVNTEYEPSATRPVFVVLQMAVEPSKINVVIVGNVQIGAFDNGEGQGTFSFICPPKQKWKVTENGSGLKSSYLIM